MVVVVAAVVVVMMIMMMIVKAKREVKSIFLCDTVGFVFQPSSYRYTN
jgi:hypothetical protein